MVVQKRPARYTLDALLEICVREFIERGYDATPMEDLARSARLTKSSIYHHVSGKEELLRLGVARGVDALFAVFDEEGSTSGRAVERLEHVVRRSADCLVAHLPHVTLLLRVRGNTEAERWALERRRELDRRLTELVQAAIEEGDLRGDLDPRTVTRLVFGMLNSVTEWYRPDGGVTGEQLADALVALSFDGLRAPGRRRRSLRS